MPSAQSLSNSRFRSIFPIYQFFILTTLLLRAGLLLRQGNDIPLTPTSLAGIFAIGWCYDTVFFSFAAVPVVLVLLLVPGWFFRNRLFQGVMQGGAFIFIYLTLFVSAAEWFFWEEFGTRFNFIAVDYLIYRREVSSNIRESYPLLTILASLLVLTLLVWWPLRRRLRSTPITVPLPRRLYQAFLLLLVPLIGGLLLDQRLHQFTDNIYVNELSANGPYQFVAAFRNNQLDYRTFYRTGNDRQLSDHLKGLLQNESKTGTTAANFDVARDIQGRGPENHANVVMITVESLSADFLSSFGNRSALTPFLDQLATRSLFFTNLYATGTRTVRGLEALMLSLPPTPGHAILKRPDNAGIFNLGSVFAQHGYDTTFLYGGYGYFDNMNTFFSGNGFRIIDRADFAKDEISFENAWGVADGDLYRKVLDEADRESTAQHPFFFEIMTTSNHRPYTYPEGKVKQPSGSGRPGAVQYTDRALADFFEAAAQKPWFDNTLFVVVADHCASSAGKDALPVAQYHIPLFIFAPKLIEPRVIDTLASQIDVAPTVLGLLNFNYHSLFFGQDLLAEGTHPRAFIGNYQRLGLLKDDVLAYLSPGKALDIVEHPLDKTMSKTADAERYQPIVDDLLSYYQGADYLLSHRLNRMPSVNRH